MGICEATVTEAISPLTVEEMRGLETDLKEFGLF